jgi:hypothetical protein
MCVKNIERANLLAPQEGAFFFRLRWNGHILKENMTAAILSRKVHSGTAQYPVEPRLPI